MIKKNTGSESATGTQTREKGESQQNKEQGASGMSNKDNQHQKAAPRKSGKKLL